ncbi:cyclin-dependent kinase 2-interacting protein-like [Belonocnema kinseyi]|uniref:cyclin-dependent kinase 2-interacting protein-like n=1 Tax=Belonocnema kinseyi TaxID=2817044 RepID=UPI00143CF9A7|nr:cyclin-dependent kinase 2-interacting protein-like [Belonocnema kinseyi]
MEKKFGQFTPVITSGSSASKGKALTGIPLQIRNLVVELHSNIQKWNAAHLKGVPIVQSIIDLKVDESYPEELIQLCSSLEKVCETADEVVNNLQIIVDKLEKLESVHQNKGILFLTWPIEKYVSTVKNIYAAYKDEAKVKRVVFENIAHQHEEAEKMVYFTSWIYQPQIPDNLTLRVEAMLIETGLR